MIVKQHWLWILLGFLLVLGSAAAAVGQEDSMRDLNDFTCKDVMRLSGNDRDVAIGVLHAFLLGKNGTTKFDAQKLGDATDQFIEYCLDNPRDVALSAMEKMIK